MIDIDKVIEAKAAKIGLSLSNFNLLMELCADLEDHAEIQALAFQKVGIGCNLTLMSMAASYQVWLVFPSRFESVKVSGANAPKMSSCDNKSGSNALRRLPEQGKTILKCYCEPFDTCQNHRLLWQSDDSVSGFEGLRQAILEAEDFEVTYCDRPKTELKQNGILA